MAIAPHLAVHFKINTYQIVRASTCVNDVVYIQARLQDVRELLLQKRYSVGELSPGSGEGAESDLQTGECSANHSCLQAVVRGRRVTYKQVSAQPITAVSRQWRGDGE